MPSTGPTTFFERLSDLIVSGVKQMPCGISMVPAGACHSPQSWSVSINWFSESSGFCFLLTDLAVLE